MSGNTVPRFCFNRCGPRGDGIDDIGEAVDYLHGEIGRLREDIDKRSRREFLPDSPLANCGAFCTMCWDANGDDINGMWNEISSLRCDSDSYGNEIEALEKSNAELLAALKSYRESSQVAHKIRADRSADRAIANAEALQ